MNTAQRQLTERTQDFYNRAFEDATQRVIQKIVSDYTYHVATMHTMTRQEFIDAILNAIGGDEVLHEAFEERFGLSGK